MRSAACTRSQPSRSASSWARSLRAWKRPSSSTLPNAGATQVAVLRGRVLAHVPRVAGAVRARRREREAVRRADVRDAARGEQRREPLAAWPPGPSRARSSGGRRSRPRARRRRTPRPGRARIAGPASRSAGAHARAPRGSRPRPSPRLHARPARPSRIPRRTPCRPPADRRSERRSSGRRPGGAGTSSSPPARRGACARRSAPAAARPAAGCAVRRWSRGAPRLYALDIVRALSMAATVPTLDTERIRDANIRYHDAAAHGYDSKWAIDYGEIGAGQVLGKLSQGARPAAGPLRPRARDRRRHRLLQPEPGASGGDRAGDRHGHLARACSSGSPRRPQELGRRRRDAGRPTPSRCPSRTSRSISCSGHAVLHHLPGTGQGAGGVPPRARTGRHAWRSWASRPLTATGSRRCRSGSARWSSRRGAARCAPPPRRTPDPPPPAEHTYGALEGLVDVHTFTPGDLRALARDAGFTDVRVSGEELLANVYGWFLRRLESDVDPMTVPLRLAPVRVPQLSRAAVGRRQAARAAAPRRPLLQPDDLGPTPADPT